MHTEQIESILAAVERLPAVMVEIEGAHSVAVRVGAGLVARIDLDGGVLVDAPADRIPILHRAFPSSRPAANGIVFDLADAQGCSEALAAIRRRVNIERLGWQRNVASP